MRWARTDPGTLRLSLQGREAGLVQLVPIAADMTDVGIDNVIAWMEL